MFTHSLGNTIIFHILVFYSFISKIISGIAKQYDPEGLIDRQVVIVANLKPREMAGLTSHGMLLAVINEGNKDISLLTLDKETPLGSKVS